MSFYVFEQVNNLFLHQPCLKSPLPVKLTWKKMQKIIFIIEKTQKHRKCPALLREYALQAELVTSGFVNLFLY